MSLFVIICLCVSLSFIFRHILCFSHSVACLQLQSFIASHLSNTKYAVHNFFCPRTIPEHEPQFTSIFSWTLSKRESDVFTDQCETGLHAKKATATLCLAPSLSRWTDNNLFQLTIIHREWARTSQFTHSPVQCILLTKTHAALHLLTSTDLSH